MNAREFTEIAGRLMRIPVAPYFEEKVRSEVEAICRENQLDFRLDEAGNVLIKVNRTSGVRPIVLAAHMDHPGFEILRSLGPGRYHARFLGGVPEPYFKPGTRVQLQPVGVPARLGQSLGKPKEYELLVQKKDWARIDGPVSFAVWDLDPFGVKQGRIHGRGCDDLIGVATILATLIELRKKSVSVIGVISRAEEIGFQGALLVAKSRILPAKSLVISLETSKELPPIAMEEGVIIRVGDKTSVFDSTATRYLTEVARKLQKADESFKFQRALMSGGTCEATAYQEYGYQTAAVCVALGNYHNCGDAHKIAEEFVSLSDALGMVRLLKEVALQMRGYEVLVRTLPRDLEALAKTARKRLIG